MDKHLKKYELEEATIAGMKRGFVWGVALSVITGCLILMGTGI